MGSIVKALNLPGRVASVKTAWGQATFLDAMKAGGYKALIHGSLAYVLLYCSACVHGQMHRNLTHFAHTTGKRFWCMAHKLMQSVLGLITTGTSTMKTTMHNLVRQRAGCVGACTHAKHGLQYHTQVVIGG